MQFTALRVIPTLCIDWVSDSVSCFCPVVPTTEYSMLPGASLRDLWYTIQDRSSFLLSLTSTDDAQLLFSQTPGGAAGAGYRITLSNDVSSIAESDTGHVISWILTPHLLNKDRFTNFWVCWRQEVLEASV